jgi:uncharacterized protein (TIGR03437 family)
MRVVSAASFAEGAAIAPDMIATAFTAAVPEMNASGSGKPLPVSLAGFSVIVRDSAGAERGAGIMAVSRGQISFVVPSGPAQGAATITVLRNGTVVASAPVRIAAVSPGVFTANSSGEGAPAGLVMQVMRDGTRGVFELFESFRGQARLEPRPFDLARGDADTYLILFGTGLRGAPPASVSANIGGAAVPVQASQAQGDFEGLDQVNLGPLPREISGRRGLATLSLTVGGVAANTVLVAPTYPPSGGWGRRAELLEGNSEMGVAGMDGKIYVLGGYPSNRVTVATVQVYDTLTDSWSLTAPLPVAVNHPMPAVLNGKLYMIGGQTDANAAYVNNVQEYDPTARAWAQRARRCRLAAAPGPRW